MTDSSPRNFLEPVGFPITAVPHKSTPDIKIYVVIRAIEFKIKALLSSIRTTYIKRFFGWLVYIGNRTNHSLVKEIIDT